jgi:hypothetical protein
VRVGLGVGRIRSRLVCRPAKSSRTPRQPLLGRSREARSVGTVTGVSDRSAKIWSRPARLLTVLGPRSSQRRSRRDPPARRATSPTLGGVPTRPATCAVVLTCRDGSTEAAIEGHCANSSRTAASNGSKPPMAPAAGLRAGPHSTPRHSDLSAEPAPLRDSALGRLDCRQEVLIGGARASGLRLGARTEEIASPLGAVLSGAG